MSHHAVTPAELTAAIRNVPDFPNPGILFRDIAPLLRDHFAEAIEAMSGLLTSEQWRGIDAVAGIESRGFILGAALALRHGKGFVPIRKQGKLPPPVVSAAYQNLPGPTVGADVTFTNAQVAPSLGRNLSSGAAGTVTVQVYARVGAREESDE